MQSKLILLSLLTVRLCCAPVPVLASPVPDLYMAQVPTTALSGAALDDAFTRALDEVLVKVTGQRSLGTDKARRRAVGPAGPLVRKYQLLAGGQVRVSFEPETLRRRLDAANLPVWADERPRTLVILPGDVPSGPVAPPGAVPPPTGTGAPATGPATGPAKGPAGSARELLLATAASRGIPVVLAPELLGGEPGTEELLLDPQSAARAAGADLLLVGRRAPVGGQAVLRWTLAEGSERAEWQGDAADGANGLADRLAARYATAAGAARVLRLRIEGINSFDDYGRLQTYLRTVGLLQRAELQRVDGGVLFFEMAVRGDVNQLNDAFALQRVLEPVPDTGTGTGTGVLAYRLLPGVVSSALEVP